MKCEKHGCELEKLFSEVYPGMNVLRLINEILCCLKCIIEDDFDSTPIKTTEAERNLHRKKFSKGRVAPFKISEMAAVDAATALKNFGKAMGRLQYDTDSKWDIRFIELAKHIASWSKDPSTKVGAVLVDHKHRIISVGFNGYPQNIPDDDLHDRERKYAKIIHAEMNALLFAQGELELSTIYVWPMAPCSQCASAIIQSGVECVVTRKATKEQYERWGDKIKLTEEMFESANVTLEYI